MPHLLAFYKLASASEADLSIPPFTAGSWSYSTPARKALSGEIALKQRRLDQLCIACLLLVVFGVSIPTHAQTLSQAALANPTRAAVLPFVQGQVKQLQTPGANWSAARSALIGPVASGNPSVQFLDVYADAINDQLLPLASNKDATIRLNAAIVAARVAAKAENIRLAPITEVLLKDNCEGVVLWGLQTAKFVVPALLAVGNTATADAIAKETVAAAKAHMSPAIVEDAYRTLLLDPTLPRAGAGSNDISKMDPKVIAAFITEPMDFYEYRIGLYAGGPPPQPLADSWATGFFGKAPVWSAVKANKQEGQVLNLMLALLKAATKENDTAASPEMLELIRNSGQAFIVAGGKLGKPALQSAAKAVSLLSANDPPAVVDAAVAALDTAVQALGLPAAPAPAPAPAVGGGAAAPPAAAAP